MQYANIKNIRLNLIVSSLVILLPILGMTQVQCRNVHYNETLQRYDSLRTREERLPSAKFVAEALNKDGFVRISLEHGLSESQVMQIENEVRVSNKRGNNPLTLELYGHSSAYFLREKIFDKLVEVGLLTKGGNDYYFADTNRAVTAAVNIRNEDNKKVVGLHKHTPEAMAKARIRYSLTYTLVGPGTVMKDPHTGQIRITNSEEIVLMSEGVQGPWHGSPEGRRVFIIIALKEF
jgi:hypothetical protein